MPAAARYHRHGTSDKTERKGRKTTMGHPYLYDRGVIETILPHRTPFLFVDGVVSFSPGESIICEKVLRSDEPFFTGHFPGRPIMPGVLISEALAQTCGLLISLTVKRSADTGDHSMDIVLAGVSVKFTTPAVPGDTIRLTGRLQKHYGNLFLFAVEASVEERKIAGGTLTLAEETP
jgi:3-hydroxyacyl-[acyl-carrier-protein] dehydratase